MDNKDQVSIPLRYADNYHCEAHFILFTYVSIPLRYADNRLTALLPNVVLSFQFLLGTLITPLRRH